MFGRGRWDLTMLNVSIIKNPLQLPISITWHFVSFGCYYAEDIITSPILFVRIQVLGKNWGLFLRHFGGREDLCLLQNDRVLLPCPNTDCFFKVAHLTLHFKAGVSATCMTREGLFVQASKLHLEIHTNRRISTGLELTITTHTHTQRQYSLYLHIQY